MSTTVTVSFDKKQIEQIIEKAAEKAFADLFGMQIGDRFITKVVPWGTDEGLGARVEFRPTSENL